MSVRCASCVLSGSDLGVGLITRPEECVVSEYDSEASIMRRPWPSRVCCAMKKKSQEFLCGAFAPSQALS